MASAKIHINLSLGLIEAEGDETFVSRVYDDFKDRIQAAERAGGGGDDEPDRGGATPQRGGRKPAVRKKASAKKANGKTEGAGGITTYVPSRNTDLDLSKLAAFVGQYAPKNNPEKYVLYITFLKDQLKIDPCSMNDLLSCFLEMKDEIPGNLGQNLIDTRGNRYGYIKFTTPHDISLSTTGINHLNHKMKKKVPE
jgi:hypothetical protein